MEAFRISKKKYIYDLSGDGAKKHGGRWNLKGTPMVYLGSTPSVVVLEYLVHIPLGAIPDDTAFATIHLPVKKIPQIDITDLPPFWSDFPFPEKVAEIGTDWITSKASLCLKVPSAVSNEDFNILLNPMHTDIEKVKIVDVKEYQINSRLFRENI